MLTITNLHVQLPEGKPILNGVSLTINPNEVHAIMGPNGAGKSTLASSLMGHPGYIVTEGSMYIDDTELTKLTPDKRFQAGLFLAFQYPVEIPGVTVANFLKTALDIKTGEKSDIIEFRTKLRAAAKKLRINDEFIDRSLNQGFSGGEKKKMEMLQLLMLEPLYAIFDETDSGLDVDALKVVGKTIDSVRTRTGILLITHYHRILSYVKPDFVHVMKDGLILKSGSSDLVDEIETGGYEHLS